MSETLAQPIRESFLKSSFKWRTAEGVAKDAGMALQDAVQALESSSDIVRASSPNKRGLALYTLRSSYKKDEGIVGRILGALANAPE